MEFGPYEIKITPAGWGALAGELVKDALRPDRKRVGHASRGENMAWALNVYIVNPGDEKIFVKHTFYGETKADAEHIKKEHLGSCSYFKAAEDEGRTDQDWEEIEQDEWPSVDDEEDESHDGR
jgi:hypothetical protein